MSESHRPSTPSGNRRKPKGVHADGSPKKRWSAQERAARGHGPRSRGGADRPARGGADRPAGKRSYGERGESRAERGESRPYAERGPRDGKREWTPREGGKRPYARDRRDRPRRDDDRPRRDDWDRPAKSRRDDRGPRHHDHAPRERNFHERDFHERTVGEDAPADTMEWHEAAPVEVDESTVTGENGFARLGVPAPLVAVLAEQGITDPFPIQRDAIPDAMAGRDVLGRGRTGSGKTLGFTLPLLARLSDEGTADGQPRAPRAIVLEPTRELAMQVADVLSPLARAVGLRALLVAGGMSYDPQKRALHRGVDVIVATPGRLIDLIEQGAADLSEVQVSVLDEADEMADMGFLPEVTRILDETPSDGQRMLFSATLDKGVDGLVKRYLHDPRVHEVDSAQATVTTMEHHLLLVRPEHKAPITAMIANRPGRTIVFARTQKGTDRIAGQLREAGVMAGALHGGLTQGARSRVMNAFKEGTVPVLVATDVAARGIHVDDIGLVLQVDPPAEPRDYTHRAGRTARAGTTGIVVTLILPHQKKSVSRLTRMAGVSVKPRETRPDDPWLAEATGARETEAEPIEDAAYEALIAPRPQGRRGGDRGGRRGGDRRGGYGRPRRGGPYRSSRSGGHGGDRRRDRD